jgi:hypothetical protein
MTRALERPSYETVVRYYLRDDVSDFFWRLCQTRRLKFFHHCDTDPRGPARARPRSIALHCVPTVEELRDRVVAAARPVPEYPYDFFPFWGMQSNRVNAPGEADRVIGRDMRFEFDYGLRDSFAVLLPIVAALEHFGVPTLAKCSGHRSMHLVVPAEAFPLPLKQQADHQAWMAALELLGDLICRIAPYLIPTNIGLSKDLTVTAPYSFHRYHGLISLPLSLEQALAFDPGEAALEAFRGTAWPFPDPWCEGIEMGALLAYAGRVQDDPAAVLDLAEAVFRGRRWAEFARENVPPDIPAGSALAALMAGAAGVSQANACRQQDPDAARRLRRALVAMDDPAHKAFKFGGLVGEVDYHHSLEQATWPRRVKAEVLSAWALDGLDAAFDRVMAIAADDRYATPIVLAARLWSFLPETDERLTAELVEAWQAEDQCDEAARLFLAIALGERSGDHDGALEALCGQEDTPAVSRFKDMLREAGTWQAEARPDLALAALVLGFGEGRVRSWIADPGGETGRRIAKGVFRGKAKKIQYAARRVGLVEG